MKNIVKVLRLKDNAARIYELPEDMTVAQGTLVAVEFPDRNSTCAGVTVSDSYVVDGETEQMVLQFHKMTPAAFAAMKKVVTIYAANPVDWTVNAPDDTGDGEADDGEADDGEADDGEDQ